MGRESEEALHVDQMRFSTSSRGCAQKGAKDASHALPAPPAAPKRRIISSSRPLTL